MGFNEFAGYLAVAASALATGWVAAVYGLRPQPFYLGVAFVAAGFALSAFVVRDTTAHVSRESALVGALTAGLPSPREVFWRTTLVESQSVEHQPGRARKQPERRRGLGPRPAGLCGRRHEPPRDWLARSDLIRRPGVWCSS
jgi:hypothetical protein